MNASEALRWTIVVVLWVVVIIPVTGIILATGYVAIKNKIDSRRHERRVQALAPHADVVELRRPASPRPHMVLLHDPKEPA